MKKKSIILIIIGLLAFLLAVLIGGIILYNISLGSVDQDTKENIEFVVSNGEATSTIIANLKKEKLIKSELSLKIYSKLNPGVPQAGNYILTKKMTAKEIYNKIITGDVTHDTVWITFVEGKRLTYIAEQIAKNFDYTVDEINAILEDKTYLKELIDKYDILTEDILNKEIYHPLEGYLFPDTYEFLSNASIKEIIEKMIATTESKISGYLEEIDESEFTIHEIITLASIVELEGQNKDNRPQIAGVFINRMKIGDRLGSDVTTYYGVGKDFSSDLYVSEINSCNGYNTRGCKYGLPVGPIASVSIESLEAAIKPSKHEYYFFVSDKNGKIYLTKTNSEHTRIISELRNKGLWYEYN